MEVFTTKVYERAIRKVSAADVRRAMEAAIAADPLTGPLIQARVASESYAGRVRVEANGAVSGPSISSMPVRKLFTS